MKITIYKEFSKKVMAFYKKHGRHTLPWRKTTDPYRILVSEVMLQQTQVERVIPYYKAFLKKFPTVRRLAAAPLSRVLKTWSGLGYNRRAKLLHDAAKKILIYENFPREYSDLIALPGVGDYTARAIRVFAWNEHDILLETNIRTVYLHHFFRRKNNVSDSLILRYIAENQNAENPRVWNWALMDYGSHLKKTLPNPSRRSAHYTKQKPFKGSDREIRGAIIRALTKRQLSSKALFDNLPFAVSRMHRQIAALRAEGIVRRNSSGFFVLAD